jgi:periplasmic copper chaperone A
MYKIKLFLILGLFLSNPLFAEENKNIQISNAWISEAPPTVSVLAAYATIQNLSEQEQTLISVSSPFFSKAELHLSKVINEMATMEKQKSLMIPAKDAVELSPGAYHLMLFDPEIPLKAGDTIIIDFTFTDGSSSTAEAIVKKRNNSGHEHHHHHDH